MLSGGLNLRLPTKTERTHTRQSQSGGVFTLPRLFAEPFVYRAREAADEKKNAAVGRIRFGRRHTRSSVSFGLASLVLYTPLARSLAGI